MAHDIAGRRVGPQNVCCTQDGSIYLPAPSRTLKYSFTTSRRPLGTKLLSGGAEEVIRPGAPLDDSATAPASSSPDGCASGFWLGSPGRRSGRPFWRTST